MSGFGNQGFKVWGLGWPEVINFDLLKTRVFFPFAQGARECKNPLLLLRVLLGSSGHLVFQHGFLACEIWGDLDFKGLQSRHLTH